MSPTRFIIDGHDRAAQALERDIRSQVVAECSAELEQAANLWQRLRVKRRMRWEIQRRIETLAPPDALY